MRQTMQATMLQTNGTAQSEIQLVQEIYGGEVYEFYPLGKYIVAAPGVCGGRPTFKYTRLEASMILAQLSTGRSIDDLVRAYAESGLTPEAVREALQLASQAFVKVATAPEPVQA
jgi:uncharacterized protein (DUF433 family)